jgi:Sensors of blue-light using FAD
MARVRNRASSVSGCLMFDDVYFTQILEGGEPDVLNIFESIKRDPRHSEIKLLAADHVPVRRFTRWDMAYIGNTPTSRAYYWKFKNKRKGRELTLDETSDLMMEMVLHDEKAMLYGEEDFLQNKG